MPGEIPLQHNMFTGELDDTRTRRQKVRDKQYGQPHQMEMFSQRDIAQFGVNPRPLLPLSPNTKLILIPEDPRTEEEIEDDMQRIAQKQTRPLFEEETQIIPRERALAVRGIVALTLLEQWANSKHS